MPRSGQFKNRPGHCVFGPVSVIRGRKAAKENEMRRHPDCTADLLSFLCLTDKQDAVQLAGIVNQHIHRGEFPGTQINDSRKN